MKNKSPEISQPEKTGYMSFLEAQASDLDEAERRGKHETNLRDLHWKEAESRKKEEAKLAQLEVELDKL